MESGRLMTVKTETFGSNCEYSPLDTDHIIGSGSFGSVYRTTITVAGDYEGYETVAVKLIILNSEQEVLVNPQRYEGIRQSLQQLITLRNTFLVAYHKIAITRTVLGARVELMMDYFEGDLATLLQRLKEAAVLIDLSTALRYSLDISEGTKFLHENGIIHADIKPANILVEKLDEDRKRLLIGDLDDRLQMKQDTTCPGDITHIRGTERYMSPEMLKKFATLRGEPRGQESPGRKTDIWSLGCVILEIAQRITGTQERGLIDTGGDGARVNAASDDAEYVSWIINKGYQPFVPETIPFEFAGCIRGCLCIATQRRISASKLCFLLKELAKKAKPNPEVQEVAIVLCDREIDVHKPSKLLAQLVDPISRTVRRIPVPDDLCQKHFSRFFTVVDDEVICQIWETGTSALETISWNPVRNSWRSIVLADVEVLIQHPVAIGSKIYFIDGNDQSFKVGYLSNESIAEFGGPSLSSRTLRTSEFRDINCALRCGLRVVYLGCESHTADAVYAAPVTTTKMWMEYFDTVTDEWHHWPDSQRRFLTKTDFEAVVINEKVYMLGGISSLWMFDWSTKSCQSLDLSKQIILDISDLPQSRKGSCAFVLNNRIYMWSGPSANESSQTAYVYNAGKDKWDTEGFRNLDHKNAVVYPPHCGFTSFCLNWPVMELSSG
ncbi:uncharacterized protein LOC129600560 [Paramacrobiotus metropolitanus]|uniref:uncharacterized protein LOC129600560 n=1 Tax=Paramacrobiotus metropolitanus TaxID=2943436 RepID=UPI0024465D1E|nr:uncharacterized protein LOC129600560 [Paramacrobiotus metropolitanus]